MNALEKLAAKASLTARLSELLYGKKPAVIKRILGGMGLGGVVGGVGGLATGGGIAGAKSAPFREFINAERSIRGMGAGERAAARKFLERGGIDGVHGGNRLRGVHDVLVGARKGLGIGAGAGAAAGGAAGALSARSAMKAYAKRRKAVNMGLGAGAAAVGGTAGLAALLGKKNR